MPTNYVNAVLSHQGFTNIRRESDRFPYVLADRDGRTYCLNPVMLHKILTGELVIARP